MADAKLALAALDWLAELGTPPELVAKAKAELQGTQVLGTQVLGTQSLGTQSLDAQTQDAPTQDATTGGDQAQSGGSQDGDLRTDDLAGAAPVREPVRLEVSPGTLKLAPGDRGRLDASRIFAEGPPEDASSEVDWTSSSSAFSVDTVGQVTAEEVTGYALSAKITATDPQSKLSGFALVAWPIVTVPVELTVTPARVVLGPNEEVRFTAIRRYADGRTEDVTSKTAWSSSQAILSVGPGWAAAAGITGEQTATITVSDPDAPLTATVEVTIVTSADTTLELTPAKDKLAPGGSMRFKAERIDRSQRTDVSGEVIWSSSNPLVTIGQDGTAVADAKALKSATGSITVLDLATNLTATATITVDVPSREVETYPTPFGTIRYFDGYEGVVKPRLQNAVQTFEMAEKREAVLDSAYEALMRKKEKIGPLLKNVAEDVRRNGKAIKADAQAASHDDLRDEDIRAATDALNQNLADARAHAVTAAGKLRSANKTVELHKLQQEAKDLDDDIDLTANSLKMVAALVDPTSGPGSKFSALMDLSATIGKRWLNPKTKEAAEAAKKLDDENLRVAADELDQARTSAAAWAKLRIKDIDRLAANAKHAMAHWQAVEIKYDTSAKDRGGFRFEQAGEILKAGEAAMKAAVETDEWAGLAEAAANDLLNFDPKPAKWLAEPDKDQETLRTMLVEAVSKGKLAGERKQEIGAIGKEIDGLVEAGRKVLLEPETSEP